MAGVDGLSRQDAAHGLRAQPGRVWAEEPVLSAQRRAELRLRLLPYEQRRGRRPQELGHHRMVQARVGDHRLEERGGGYRPPRAAHGARGGQPRLHGSHRGHGALRAALSGRHASSEGQPGRHRLLVQERRDVPAGPDRGRHRGLQLPSPKGQGEGRGGARRVAFRGRVGDVQRRPLQGGAHLLPRRPRRKGLQIHRRADNAHSEAPALRAVPRRCRAAFGQGQGERRQQAPRQRR